MAQVLALMKSRPAWYATAGWMEDRGLSFNEHTIATACRRLVVEKKMDQKMDCGFQKYGYITNLKEVLEERAKKRKLPDDFTRPVIWSRP